MPSRVIKTPEDAAAFAAFIVTLAGLPITVSWAKGVKRTHPQNALAHRWYKEIADQRGDTDAEETKAECKLRFGVPILRRENEAWRVEYDAMLKPLGYAQKLRLVQFVDLPVTRHMTTAQQGEYMDAIAREYRPMGFRLTDPEMMKYEWSDR